MHEKGYVGLELKPGTDRIPLERIWETTVQELSPDRIIKGRVAQTVENSILVDGSCMGFVEPVTQPFEAYVAVFAEQNSASRFMALLRQNASPLFSHHFNFVSAEKGVVFEALADSAVPVAQPASLQA